MAPTIPETMDAWVVDRPGPVSRHPLHSARLPVPEPVGRELLVRIEACAVCRTDLHLAEGDLLPRRPRTVPGHEAVGRVAAWGPHARPREEGERVGIAWLRGTCGRCRYCARGAENLCPSSLYTGWDADGGYAEYAVVDDRYAYRLPLDADPVALAPLLCAGIIGYRALERAEPPDGARVGIYGFGASAHLAAQVALAKGATVHVVTRSARARRLAAELGCASASPPAEGPPELLDSAVLFAPAGELVPKALESLDRGGTLAVAGIHLSDVPALNYQGHLFQERTLRSVTANTRADGRAFLDFAVAHGIRVETERYPLSRADAALEALAAGSVNGAAVLVPGEG
ncbi:zinc-binding alcohol dehydrogenase family protein [Nocardiopsis chromatogenes]|uniref:zinc-binding alcohol dehydrogenase family protein n=1 Tax=Nocardiopsis chromatogenes TaxID=280239 RepID=UPI00034504FC|nr:zinc-binding alcohol dehydrogenase family protein [Nocardiopsis chromatogenes]